jgi:predicted RNase H-like nuclease (RuvC/YqgF family)
MADEKNDSEEVAPGVVTSDSVDDAAENNEKLEEARKGSEQVVDEDPETGTVEEGVNETPTEPDFEKMFDALKGSVNETLEKNKVTVEEAVATVKTHVEEVTKAFDDKASEFEKSLGELSERLDSLKSEREEVSKRLDGLEKATAIRKSGDVETQPQEKKVQKGLWSGAFFDNEA